MEFTDDSSASLGLNHRATLALPDRIRAKAAADLENHLREIGMADISQVQRVVAGNIGATDGISRRMQKYIDQGYGTLDAIALAEAEDEAEPDPDILGDNVENLMAAPVDVKGGGTKSRKRSSGRTYDPLQAEMKRHFQGLI